MDDAVSECGLDGRTWDLVIQNDGAEGDDTTYAALLDFALGTLQL